MILHRLNGCAPTPLARYLKALGVLRLVAEQLDPEARSWWEGERFLLASNKDEDELLAFFLNTYAPTPLVSPWNKGSGFFYPNDPGLTPIETSTAPRLLHLRDGCRAARALLDALSAADQQVRTIKAEGKDKTLSVEQRRQLTGSENYKKRLADAEREFKRRKAELIPDLRLHWRGPHREWMDAAMVLGEDGVPRFPALLGTGGNDGRLDFTNNFFQRLGNLFDLAHPAAIAKPDAVVSLREALFADVARTALTGLSVGQYSPGDAGGANGTNAPDADSRLNAWDFILMLEGTLLFTASSTRRMESHASARAAAPFAVGSQAAGYASAADSDEGARGEQWMPLWSQPMTCCELHRLLAEGRVQLGGHAAREPLDLAKAVARLGTARGIKAFQRYGYIERNGQSNLAVPLGRFVVTECPTTSLACLDDLESWLPRLRRCARERDAPRRLKQAERRLADALFAVIQHPHEPMYWQAVLLQLADVEAIQVHGAGRKAGPIPRLRPDWARAADDGSTEIRLAVAMALQVADARGGVKADGVRRHWVTLEKGRFKDARTDRVMQGRNGRDDAIAVVARRLVEVDQRGERRLPLEPGFGIAASPHDLASLLAGEVDLNRCLALARTLMALDSRACVRAPPRLRSIPYHDWPDDAWLAIRLALMPHSLVDGRHAGCDPAILRRLVSGNIAGAFALARRRLRAAGIDCGVRMAAGTPEQAYLYAAALVFPISRYTAANFSRRLAPASIEETAA